MLCCLYMLCYAASGNRYDHDVARRALTAEAERKEREEEAARAAGEQRSMEAAVVLQCSYRMHLARLLLDATKNPKVTPTLNPKP